MTQPRVRIIDADTPGVPRDHGQFNVNGPSVLAAPDWMPDPPGRYLMYFAHHLGQSIRVAAADEPVGPWRVVEPDVLNVKDTPSDGHPHVASPDVHADESGRRFVMYFHGMVPESVGGRLPCWGTYPSLNQKTMVATSGSGRRFGLVEPVVAVAPSYLRMFDGGDAWYGVAMPSQVVRSTDGLRGFEYGPMLFDDDEIRHCCLSFRPERRELEMLFTRCYEAPERIYRTVIDTSGDWRQWTPGPVSEVMGPKEPWEGADEPLRPVPRGLASTPQNGLRDPCLLDADGRRWLFYAAAGEDALGVTEIATPPNPTPPANRAATGQHTQALTETADL